MSDLMKDIQDERTTLLAIRRVVHEVYSADTSNKSAWEALLKINEQLTINHQSMVRALVQR